MNEKLARYIAYIVQHHLRNDAGILWVQNSLQGNAAAWLLAVRGYIRAMGAGEAGYEAFRRKWAWSDERVQRVLDSPAGADYRQRIADVQAAFGRIAEMAGYTLSTGDIRRSLNTQTRYFRNNWSVALLGADLLRQTQTEVDRATYPDPPAAASAALLRRFIRNAALAAVDNPGTTAVEAVTSPTNATPGLSDHGRLSAVDFVVMRGRAEAAGASTGQIGVWRRAQRSGMSFDTALRASIATVNGGTAGVVFEGPLAAPDEPWHYTYLPIQTLEAAEDTAAAPPTE